MKTDQIRLISRREFLKLAGMASGLTAGAVAAGQVLFSDLMAVPEKVLERVARQTGQESWINTVCRQCPGGCGIQVRRIDGVPVHIRGNPLFPVNRGGVCPLAHTSLEVLFHPDRLRSPLKRAGAKGSGQWSPLGWPEALNSLTRRLRELIGAGNGHRIALLNGDNSNLLGGLGRHLLRAAGSPNYLEDEKLASNNMAVRLSHGIEDTPSYDLANSKYILNFGSNFMEEGTAPVYYQKLWGHIRSAETETRPRLVHIDSRINLTAAAADRWVPIRPGTYGALALGLAYVLIVNKLYDRALIKNYCTGFDSSRDQEGTERMGFESFVRANYYPEAVAEITGIPTATIIQLGEDFGTHQPAVALADDAARYTTNGSYTSWAVYCLNALVGNIQQKGGVYFTPPVPEFEFPDLELDQPAGKSLAQPPVGAAGPYPALLDGVNIDQLAEEIVRGGPGQIDTLIIIDSNPVYHSRNRQTLIQALERIQNVVYMGIFVDETAQYSDLILPDHSYLEKTDLSGPTGGLSFAHLGYQQPVIGPVFNTSQSGDLLIEAGRTLFGSSAFPWKNYRELVQQRWQVIYESGEGAVISESLDAEWFRYLKERGWKMQPYETFPAFNKLLKENGGWWNPVDPARPFEATLGTESGKFEFSSALLETTLGQKAALVPGKTEQEKQDRLLSGRHIATRGEALFLPHYEPPFSQVRSEDFPLLLTVSQLLTNRDGKGASQPSMLEMVGIQVGHYWESWVEINPQTGREHGLQDGEPMWVESVAGRIAAEARFFEGIRPGVVHLHLGLGHSAYGRYGSGVGVNACDLIENNYDTLTNTPALNGTRVKVGRLTAGV